MAHPSHFSTRPGTEFFWFRILVVELADFLLQLARLANFGGMNSLSGQSVLAETDSVVLVLYCALCLDLVMLGICIFKRNVFWAMAFVATLDTLYTCGPPLWPGPAASLPSPVGATCV